MKPVKLAIVGYGPGGSIYNAPIIGSIKDFQISKILSSSPENMEAAKKDFPEAEVVQDYDNILKDPEIELVVIPLPNHLHMEYAEQALKENKHVVVEKPITPTVVEADYLIQMAKERNLILSVNHNRRWDSDLLTIKKLLEEKTLGDVVEYEAHFDRFRPEIKESWKEEKEVPGSGILYDLGSHLIDQALLLFGIPDEIYADLRVQRENSEVVDNFELILGYPDLKVILKAGMLVREPGPRYRILGRKGSFTKFGMDVQEEKLKKKVKPNKDVDWGKEPKKIWGTLRNEEGETKIASERGDYRRFFQNIYDAIRKGAVLEVRPEEARTVIQLIELAYKSNQEKCAIKVEITP